MVWTDYTVVRNKSMKKYKSEKCKSEAGWKENNGWEKQLTQLMEIENFIETD